MNTVLSQNVHTINYRKKLDGYHTTYDKASKQEQMVKIFYDFLNDIKK